MYIILFIIGVFQPGQLTVSISFGGSFEAAAVRTVIVEIPCSFCGVAWSINFQWFFEKCKEETVKLAFS